MIWIFASLSSFFDFIFWVRNSISDLRGDSESASLHCSPLHASSSCLSLLFSNCNDRISFCLIFNSCRRVSCISVRFSLTILKAFWKYSSKSHPVESGSVSCSLLYVIWHTQRYLISYLVFIHDLSLKLGHYTFNERIGSVFFPNCCLRSVRCSAGNSSMHDLP